MVMDVTNGCDLIKTATDPEDVNISLDGWSGMISCVSSEMDRGGLYKSLVY